MAIEDDRSLSRSQYWDDRYSLSNDAPTHEWFRSFANLEPFFRDHFFGARGLRIDDNPAILHLGSGDSHIPTEFAARGYRRQLCVDFSAVVVDLMTERHRGVEGINWACMDVRNMDGVADRSIDLAFDKGTFDAMIYGSPWNPLDEVKENTSQYLKEVHRVLKNNGIFLYVTFRQPHFTRPLLDIGGLWDLDMKVLGEGGSFDYYGFIIKKHLAPLETK